ncbi:MAG: cation:proton antiporter [Planctomycetota bacterium]|nr:cation:proton antiporter [Planctomycetota bacterium]
MSSSQLAIHFFLQFAAILLACRVVGLIVRRFGQPQVVGEMIAGVCLGPSLLGLFAPQFQSWLFPKLLLQAGEPLIVDGIRLQHPLMSVLYCIAQLGLVLYMFCIGTEFDAGLLRNRARAAFSVSLAGILAPFLLGGLIAWMYRGSDAFFMPNVQFGEEILFMGAAMSITAFPMLARIIHERGLTGTSIGTLALAAGSSDDAAAWCILAIVLAGVSDNPSIALLAIGGGIAYAAFVLLALRPLLARIARHFEPGGKYSDLLLPGTLILLSLAAWFTDLVGIYAVFGAFVLGIAMPRGPICEKLRLRIEPLTTSLLLPAFFVYSGLNTQLATINTNGLFGAAVLILLASVAAKGLACFAAAKLHGEPTRDAMAIGALMNARGLMELILLNIGLERGVITPALFAILVIMAIVTTLMATPIFELVYGRKARSDGLIGASH